MLRTCGTCIACCVYLRIEAPTLNKSGMVHCPHLDLPGPEVKDQVFYTGKSECGNCRIHSEKPECCATYACLWLQGHGLEEDRPDRSLMLFDTTHQIANAIEAKPLKDGREETEEGKAVINRMSASACKPVIVLNFYERRIRRVVGRPETGE